MAVTVGQNIRNYGVRVEKIFQHRLASGKLGETNLGESDPPTL
jgi:hypothetical protein